MSLDPRFYLTVTCYQKITCVYCDAEETVAIDDAEPYDGGDPLEHDEDCDRLDG